MKLSSEDVNAFSSIWLMVGSAVAAYLYFLGLVVIRSNSFLPGIPHEAIPIENAFLDGYLAMVKSAFYFNLIIPLIIELLLIPLMILLVIIINIRDST